MAKDYVPDSVQNVYDWASTLFTQIATQGLTAGWDAAKITAFQALVSPIRDAAKAVLDAQSDLDTKKGALNQARDTNLSNIRQGIKNLKSSPGYDSGMGKSLGVHLNSSTPDPNAYQPVLSSAVAHSGYVRVIGKKLMADSLNIYSRLKGQANWKLLASKRVHFPFDDDAPLAQANTPETREYQAIGVNGDSEFGQPSEIVSVVYGG